ncbi:MAG TPA: amino acid ABC transporter substrate-binding protein [Candidatus Ornithoclostridium faecavium]|nr:amino acid ABC transporter substrate-binding protein [Candidatus Ornithoclostridium faecavium]
MKKKIVLLTVVAVVAALSLSVILAGCTTVDMSKAGPEEIKEYGKLVVATSPDFPPFESLDKAGNVIGWDIDVAKALAEKLGVELEIQKMEFDAVLSSVAAGKVHIGMAGISNTAKRDESVDFSLNVFDSSQMIIVRADNTSINGPMDLAGKTVAVQAGTIGNWLAEMDEDYAYNFDDDGNVLLDEPILGAPKTVTKLSSGLMAIQQVKNGQADAVILDKLPAKTIVEKLNAEGGNQLKILDMSVYDDAYAFAIGEGNTALKAWIDEALTELKEEGFFEELNSKWFGSEEE